jgi:O-antigen ligase
MSALLAARRQPIGAWLIVGAAVLVVVAGVAASHVSPILFGTFGLLLAAIVAYASLTWPRQALVVVVLSPLLDRYLAPGILAPEVEGLAHFLSEGLLLTVGVCLVAQAVRRGTLRAAVWHPTAVFALVFLAAAVASAVINGVLPVQAIAGIAFTLDALAIFFLARLVEFNVRQALLAIGAFIAFMSVAAWVALAQAILTPNLLGLFALQGRFGEVYRLASIFGDPNVFAALLSAAVPFVLFGAPGLATRRGRGWALALASLLILALWLSFSRGGWLGAAFGFGIASTILDRRALAVGIVLAAVTFAIAWVMPRDLLESAPGGRPDIVGSTGDRIGAVGAGRDLRVLFLINSIPLVVEHPALGVGPGRYGGAAADIFGTDVYAQYGTDQLFRNPTQRTIDNFWLHLLGETGIIGLMAFLAMIGIPLIEVIRAARSAIWARRVLLSGIAAAVLALSANSVTTMLLEANSVAYMFWFLLGIGSVLAVPAATSRPLGRQPDRSGAERGGDEPQQQGDGALAQPELEQAVVDVAPVGHEHRLAGHQATHDGPEHVAQRHAQRNQRHPRRDAHRSGLGQADGAGGQQVAEDHRAGVTHDDAGRVQVVAQEADGATCAGGQHDQGRWGGATG